MVIEESRCSFDVEKSFTHEKFDELPRAPWLRGYFWMTLTSPASNLNIQFQTNSKLDVSITKKAEKYKFPCSEISNF